MIPVQLTIKGLYSYQEKQTIDFTKLTAASLFGIFGTVGSGKSSILEAITFAVYGRTDRLNLSGDNRYYNMMNLKSNELLIDFIFETGREQTAYRATVKGKRNSKKFEDVKALDRTAYKKEGNEWRPIENETLEQAIGLSYDNFKRTIIIPQGQFQEFLQLGNKDRTQMMKELFNLGKFEFYYKVASLESKNNEQKQNIEGQLKQLGAVDPEQANIFQAQLTKLEEELKEQNRKLAENQKAEEQLRKLQELTQKKAEAEKERKKLQEQEPEFQALEKKITRYEQCVYRFKHLLDSLNENRKKQEEREKQIRTDSEKLKAEEVEIEQLEKLLEKLKPAYEKRETLKQKAEELSRLVQMKKLKETIANEESRLKKGEEILNTTLHQHEKLKTEKQQLEAKIKAARGKIPDLELLSTIRAWYIEKHNLNKQLPEIEKEIEKYVQQEKEIREEVSQILTEPVFKDLAQEADYKTCIQHLKAETLKIKDKQKELNEQQNHFRVKAQLKSYAEELEEGKPCPLCGSVHHPELFKAEDNNNALAELTAKQQNFEQQLEQISELGNRLNFLENQMRTVLQNHKESNERKKEQLQQISAHAQKFIWEKYREEEELNGAFREAKRIQGELKEHEKSLESTTKKLTLEEKNKERYQAELEKIDKSLTVHQTEQKTIVGQLLLIQPENYIQIPVEQIEKEKKDLLNEYSRIEKEVTEKTTSLQERNKQKDILSGSLKTNRTELEKDQETTETLKKRVDEQLAESSFQSVDEVVQILSEPLDTDAEKQKVAQFNKQLDSIKSSLEQFQNEIGERVYDADSHKKLIDGISLLKEQITQKNQEQGKTAEMLKKLQKDLENQAALRKELELLEVRAENIKTMKLLFKASGFVNYISSVYLQNLCNAANDRFFQLTRQKLSLEITPDNNFQVRDFMNGGKIRSVKTLSGGQTFQAALSLALALADNIQKITESNQNFFFLDEGFGSLDKESLNIVFDTLKSLRKENRIVGVISHVEEMQQEIDVHLRIENQAEKGSVIHSSWTE
ncbi:exonuclease SbcC [Tangfeifania diversioriginum]|uniref:Exonuclease SbcC n=1 Tax=Tangfeifania diversioriginum TaxID=1168035 RepID=A0A1M6NX28_9BACT|nr:AAA family ATPase [Tangfeifania diversioriginum]SHK00243.1 exonuclease SbcC [Tangfeifania diversioriginum]